jgi:hypothetical protein
MERINERTQCKKTLTTTDTKVTKGPNIHCNAVVYLVCFVVIPFLQFVHEILWQFPGETVTSMEE